MRFRPSALLFVLICSAFPAYSQTLNGIFCSGSVPSVPTVSGEGVTELVGDVLLSCTGGTATYGGSVPTVNITIASNTQITSRILPGTTQITEAVLLINDPGSPSSGLTQTVCPADAANNFACDTNVTGTGAGGGAGIIPLQYTNANIYQGVLTAPNQLTFFNVPIDPPGPTFFSASSSQYITPVLTLRFKNIRVNASALSAQSPVTLAVATSAGIPISGPDNTVGTVLPGLANRSVSGPEIIPQCSVSTAIEPAYTVSVTEGAPNSFLQQFPATITDASVPGNTGISTSGFLISGLPRTAASPGVADFGTRIKLSFYGAPPGVTLYVPASINSGIFPPSSPTTPTLTAVLTSTEAGPFSAVAATNGMLAAVPNNEAIYEVVSVLPESLTTIETLTIPVSLSYSGSQGSLPTTGAGTVQIDFAPSASAVTTNTVPRFIIESPSISSYTITSCAVTGLSAYSASQSALVNMAFPNPLQALVKDSGGNPVNNSAVTFTLPTNGPGALFAGGGNVAVAYSNAQGIATSPQLIANSNLGAFNATASSGAMSVNLPLTNLPGISTLTLVPIPNHYLGDAPFTLSASASASPGAITFSIVSGPATVSGLVVTITGVGTVVVQASQAATASYAAATATQSFVVSPPQVFTGLTCFANAATPLEDRAEGIAETVDDVVISCTGGTPTQSNVAVPTMNITVDLNTQVTSRLLTGNATEALLIINDPQTTAQVLCSPNVTNNYACPTTVYGTGAGGGKGMTPSPYNGANIYQGVLTGPDELTFFNVPVDPPGPAFLSDGGQTITPQLFLRITNVRVDAAGLGAPVGFNVSTASESISTSADIPIFGATQVVGSVFSGLVARAVTGQSQFSQCSAQSLQPAFNVSFAEGFSTAFNPRFLPSIALSSIPGYLPNTTSDFLISGFPVATSSPGVADFATRFKLTFLNSPPGVTLYVPVSLGSNTLNAGVPTQIIQLTATEGGPFSTVTASTGTNGLLAAVTNNEAIYEVYSEQAISQNTIESYTVPVYLSYSASPGSYPTPGTGSVLVDFAPSSTVINASTGPIPRFAQGSPAINTYTITSCVQPTIFIDTPGANATLSGTATISGWALENNGTVGPNAIASVTVFVDNNQVGTATYGISRTDVCAVFPGRPGCPNVGWTYPLNVAALSNGSHTLRVVATDTAGTSSSSTVNFNANPLLPSVVTESPIPNGTLSGTVAIGGWALENSAAVGPSAISSVAIFVDNAQVGTASYGVFRPDVCGAFPGRLGCPNVGWAYDLNVGALSTGSHTLKVVATDTSGNAASNSLNFTAAAPVLVPTISIEAPAANATISGITPIGGWALENAGAVGPAAVSSVNIFVDGNPVGTATYGISRPDVCGVFPGRLGCPNVGWSYNLNVSAFTPGSHTLKAVATDSANNSSFTQTTFIASALQPSIVLEGLAPNATLTGTTLIGGWAIENTGMVGPDAINSVIVYIDGAQVGTAAYGIARPDVCGVFPGRLGCPNVGWSYSLSIASLSVGSHMLKVVATDTVGNSAFTQTTINTNPAPLPSVVIESPAQNATLAGTVQIGGWAIENVSTVGPDAIASMIVSVDGSQVGTAFYGSARPDVCGVFPGRVGCPNVGWNYSLNVSSLAAGMHTLTITAMDSAGNHSSASVSFVK